MIYAVLITAAVAVLPPDAAALKAKRDAKVAEIDRIYALELEKCQKRAMEDGNLAGANEIEQEFERLFSDPLKPKAAADKGGVAMSPEMARLKGLWKRESDSIVWEFKDGKSGLAGQDKFTMSYNAEEKKYILVSEKWVNKLSFGLSDDVLNGEDSGTFRFKLKRIK
ncbi:hypothetical protein JIN84_06215 [Luteolibacter yonseiensis]|uniref:Uncharacterized protein n=2 Tax=Luteolibacter yonseiensis TaxID=1144680 RepID=A0A934V9J1_9BACT|nr:hypothetical protein [Luteolibacter yonseiensis]